MKTFKSANAQLTGAVLRATFLRGSPPVESSPESSVLGRLAGARGDAVVVGFEAVDAMALVCFCFRSAEGESIGSTIMLCCVVLSFGGMGVKSAGGGW